MNKLTQTTSYRRFNMRMSHIFKLIWLLNGQPSNKSTFLQLILFGRPLEGKKMAAENTNPPPIT